MSSKCPAAPTSAAGALNLAFCIVKEGTRLVRYHGIHPVDSFNPNTGKKMKEAADGSRFNPFPGSTGVNVPTLYAADCRQAAALESVFHNVEHCPSPFFNCTQLEGWNCGELLLLRDLSVFELTNPRLRQLAVPRRKGTSLQELELIHTPGSQYPQTRTWAKYLHASIPTLDGLAWRPRLGGTGWAYLFFGDRCNKAIKSIGPSLPIHEGSEFVEIKRIAQMASIRLV